MKLTKKQQLIRKYENKYRPKHTVCEGSVRSGKTYMNNMLWLIHIAEMKNKKRDFTITGHTIGSIERNILKPLFDDFGVTIKLNNKNRFSLFGNHIHCFGGGKYDSYKDITGMTSYGWYANEVTLQHANTINECFNRCSGDGARIFWDTNPDYPEHPIKINYIDKSGDKLSNGTIRLKAWHFTLDDNEMLSKEYIEMIKKSTPIGMWYDRKIKGLWVAAEGIVYENYDRNIHIIKPFEIPSHWQRYRAIDWGYTNPFCCLWGALDPDGRLYIYKEHYKAQMLIKDHATIIKKYKEYIKDKDNNNIRQIRYIKTVADHDAQDNAELKAHGIRTKNADKDVHMGIQKVAERLVIQQDGKPRLYIFDNCSNLKREFPMYQWIERKEGKPIKEEPLKLNDHAMDSLRYLIMEIDTGKHINIPSYSAGALGL
jgi:PBSX family phage terminase large subunit